MNNDFVMLADMYRYVAILFLSHTSGFRLSKTIDILRQSGSSTTSLERIRFIAGKILAFCLTGRSGDSNME